MIDSMPYSNIHELNLDWILSKIKYFESWVQGEAEDDIREMIQNIWNNFMLGAVYTEDDETIHFTLSEMTGEESEATTASAGYVMDCLNAISYLLFHKLAPAMKEELGDDYEETLVARDLFEIIENRINNAFIYLDIISYNCFNESYNNLPTSPEETETLLYRIEQLEANSGSSDDESVQEWLQSLEDTCSAIGGQLDIVSLSTLSQSRGTATLLTDDERLINRINDLEARIVELEGGEQG